MNYIKKLNSVSTNVETMLFSDAALYKRALNDCKNIDHDLVMKVKMAGGIVSGTVISAEPYRFKETRCTRSVIFKVIFRCSNSDSMIPGAPKTVDREFHLRRIPVK